MVSQVCRSHKKTCDEEIPAGAPISVSLLEKPDIPF